MVVDLCGYVCGDAYGRSGGGEEDQRSEVGGALVGESASGVDEGNSHESPARFFASVVRAWSSCEKAANICTATVSRLHS